jgi:hypothetical protein
LPEHHQGIEKGPWRTNPGIRIVTNASSFIQEQVDNSFAERI